LQKAVMQSVILLCCRAQIHLPHSCFLKLQAIIQLHYIMEHKEGL
jgi:hypothetical protein